MQSLNEKKYNSAVWKKNCTGFGILLDAVPARTPLGNPITVPTQALAEAIAEEWRASIPSHARGRGSKANMHLTAIACIAIDLGETRRDALIEELVGYGETDLVCYRAGGNPELEAEQEALLAPVLRWAKDRYGLDLHITGGLMPVKQPEENAQLYTQILSNLNPWQLAIVATAAKALGSLILALMLLEGALDAGEAFRLSHLEETYETRAWGPDDEKEAKLELSRKEIESAAAFVQHMRLSSENRD